MSTGVPRDTSSRYDQVRVSMFPGARGPGTQRVTVAAIAVRSGVPTTLYQEHLIIGDHNPTDHPVMLAMLEEAFQALD